MAAKTHSTPEIPMGKHIAFNRDSKDFDFFYDRQYLGSRAERRDAEECLNEYAYDLARGYITPACAQDADPIPFPETVAVNVAPAQVDEPVAAIKVTPVYRQANGDLSWEAGVEVVGFDYTIGEGLTKVLIGVGGGVREGIELIIGGSALNQRLSEVITLADVRRLRDNLSALLTNPRVQQAA